MRLKTPDNRHTVFLPPDLQNFLRQEVARQRCTASAVLRQALSHYRDSAVHASTLSRMLAEAFRRGDAV